MERVGTGPTADRQHTLLFCCCIRSISYRPGRREISSSFNLAPSCPLMSLAPCAYDICLCRPGIHLLEAGSKTTETNTFEASGNLLQTSSRQIEVLCRRPKNHALTLFCAASLVVLQRRQSSTMRLTTTRSVFRFPVQQPQPLGCAIVQTLETSLICSLPMKIRVRNHETNHHISNLLVLEGRSMMFPIVCHRCLRIKIHTNDAPATCQHYYTRNETSKSIPLQQEVPDFSVATRAPLSLQGGARRDSEIWHLGSTSSKGEISQKDHELHFFRR